MLLERASSRRAVAATLMNERSSRSHSVFSLKVRGVNPLTEERCEGTLNLGMSFSGGVSLALLTPRYMVLVYYSFFVTISEHKFPPNHEKEADGFIKLFPSQSIWQVLNDLRRPVPIPTKIE